MFSFYGNKVITTGEGGMLVTSKERLAKRARFVANHSMHPRRRYWHPVIGFNYRLSNIQAALGLAQLERIDELLADKQRIFHWYQELLADTEVELNPCAPGVLNSFWLVCALLPRGLSRDGVISQLREYGIETRPLFYPMHTLPAFRKYAQARPTPAVAADIAARGISLPSGVKLSQEDVYCVANALKRVVHDRLRKGSVTSLNR
jgi:perosamine synthetase